MLAQYYSIVRITDDAETPWLVHVETLETQYMTWPEFVAYAKSRYHVTHQNKRAFHVVVR